MSLRFCVKRDLRLAVALIVSALACAAPTSLAQPSTTPDEPTMQGNVQDLLVRGDALYDEQLFDRALTRYQEAEKLDPENLRVQLRLAKVFGKLGQRAPAIAALNRILDSKPELKDNAEIAALRSELEAIPATASPSPGAAEPTKHEDAAKLAQDALAAQTALNILQRVSGEGGDKDARSKAVALAREKLSDALADPDQSNLEVWRAAGIIAVIQEDDDLAAYAFDAISRLKPDYDTDAKLLKLMARINERPIETLRARIPESRANLSAYLSQLKNPSTLVLIGDCFRDSQGVPRNDSYAMKWYRKAADAGNDLGLVSLGDMYLAGRGDSTGQPNAALSCFQRAAAGGSDYAMFKLGLMYEKGRGVIRDYSQAIAWYEKAAAAGNLIAMWALGSMYTQGLGVDKSDSSAVEWYAKSANGHYIVLLSTTGSAEWFGYPPAMRELGECYERGRGVQKSLDQAIIWYRKAATMDDSQAMFILGLKYISDEVPRDEGQAVAWFRKAAAKGNSRAMCNLGFAYFNGQWGIPIDKAR